MVLVRPCYISSDEKNQILARLWEKDPGLWAQDPETKEAVSNRLGWLDIVPKMRKVQGDLAEFSSQIRQMNLKRGILLGMGGSSLCPLVLSKVFGPIEGHPELQVLDTTDPDEIEKCEDQNAWEDTLFIFASKSGTTVEPNALFNYFWDVIKDQVKEPGKRFIAITDPGTQLEELAKERGFLRTFLNPPDIGGRYSALSYFGLVPAAILGLDIELLLNRAEEMMKACGPDVPWNKNPGCQLGEFLGEYAGQSRDKLNIFADPDIRPFALWLEQLLAESTGKETQGILPVVGETTGIPGFYGGERIFAYLRLEGTAQEDALDAFIKELREAEFPVFELRLKDKYDLGGQFFLWEMATALASHFIGVNAFDEPNVRSAKEKTRQVLEIYKKEGKVPAKFWVDPKSQILFKPSEMLAATMKGLSRTIRDLFQVLPSWGYVAFLPYLPYDPKIEEIIGEMRQLVRQEKGCATTMGYGPRYLHSTGQYYKGGPISGGYFIFTRKRSKDYPEVPGFGASFWHIQFAQAVGDFQALAQENRRVIHVHLPSDFRLGLESFSKVLSRAVRL